MENVTKKEFVSEISDNTGLTKQEVQNVVEGLFDKMCGELAKGNTVVFRNFGTFEVRASKPKLGRNPKKPEDQVMIPPRAVVRFRPSKNMKQKVATALPVIIDSQ